MNISGETVHASPRRSIKSHDSKVDPELGGNPRIERNQYDVHTSQVRRQMTAAQSQMKKKKMAELMSRVDPDKL